MSDNPRLTALLDRWVATAAGGIAEHLAGHETAGLMDMLGVIQRNPEAFIDLMPKERRSFASMCIYAAIINEIRRREETAD